MMKKYISYKLIGLALLVVSMVACETASQDVTPVSSPDGYPVATIALSSASTSVVEGDTLIYTISTNRPIDRSVTFSGEITGGTAGEDDYIIKPATLAPYTTEVDFYIIAVNDGFPEVSETLQLKFSVSSIADRYLLNSSTVLPAIDVTIVNYNDPEVLTIAFGWPNPDDDIDTYALFAPATKWGSSAGSDNPEILTAIWPSDPNGTYYFGIDPYLVNEPVLEYTISIGYPDQTVQFINGGFDTENIGSYTLDHYGTQPIYRLLSIVNLDGVFTITNVNP